MLAISQALAKVEALALIGATLFREATFRSKNCHVTWPRFTMPHAPEAGIDKYGRDHVVPEWFGNSDNREFLTQLQFRMKLVEVRLRYLSTRISQLNCPVPCSPTSG